VATAVPTLVTPSADATKPPFCVWQVVGPKGPDKKQTVKINHGELVSALAQVKTKRSVTLLFDVEEDEIECELGDSAVMALGLASKYKNIRDLTGSCSDGSVATVTVNAGKRGTFKATILKEDVLFYADPDGLDADSDVLALFRKRDIPKPDRVGWTDDVLVLDDDENRLLLSDTPVNMHGPLRSLIPAATPKGYKFRFAVITTKEYSNVFGNTIESVLTEIVSLLARLNGVYLRELGVMFELIADYDKLICLGESDYASLVNFSPDLNQIAPFMLSQGVTADDYDIGHSFTTGAGGLAGLGVLCGDYKAWGVTGLSNPTGGPFYIDYVAHEVGHQLKGCHSFRNCGVFDSNLSNQRAVEPGGGTSIMSYAGICGTNNLQSNSDPFLNSKQLVTMRTFIEEAQCGESFDIINADGVAAVKPIMDTFATCTVPKGNYVHLGGRVQNKNLMTKDVFFAWDRVDPGAEDYLDEDVPRFAPREPTTRSSSRFLPSMYILSFGFSTLEEIAPRATVSSDDVMTFRFVGRTTCNDSWI
jgi:hypothetical protein